MIEYEIRKDLSKVDRNVESLRKDIQFLEQKLKEREDSINTRLSLLEEAPNMLVNRPNPLLLLWLDHYKAILIIIALIIGTDVTILELISKL